MAFVLRGHYPQGDLPRRPRMQYTSAQIADLCADLGLLQSVGRTGVCWDNAATESFWSTLKTEFYNRHIWATKAEAARRRPLDRGAVQPTPTPLLDPHDDPRPVRTPPTDGYPGRLTACPSERVIPKVGWLPLGSRQCVLASNSEWHFGLDGAIAMANAYPQTPLLLHHWGCVDAPDFPPFNADPATLPDRVINPDRILSRPRRAVLPQHL